MPSQDKIPSQSPATGTALPANPQPKLANLIQKSAHLEELGTPSQHISSAPFVLIPDENLEEAKEELKEFVSARFQGDVPPKGRIIGVVNAIWARNGPRIFIHQVGRGCFLLKVTNERTRQILLSRPAWMIAGSPMFVAPWSSDFDKKEPKLTTTVIPVELRGVPYLLFNQQSLSRLATAIGKPVSLAPETERKENFKVAKVWVKVNLLAELPDKIISGFSSGREVEIDVTYPWLPKKYSICERFGHDTNHCPRQRSSVVWKQRETNDTRPRSQNGHSRGRESKKRRATSLPVKNKKDIIVDCSESAVKDKSQNISKEIEVEAKIIQDTCTDSERFSPAENVMFDTAEPISVSKQVISLDRQFGYSSVTVYHEGNERSPGHGTSSEDQNDDPFLLVSNRKSSRKATKN